MSTAPKSTPLVFDEHYFKTGCGLPYERNYHWTNFFRGIATEIIRALRPKTVFDAGCAWGLLVEALWDQGVEACGVDISEYAISNLRPDMRPYCRVGSLTEPLEGSYDLVTCIEVLEHMPPDEAEIAVSRLVRLSDTILFSSTPNDFDEPTHVNVRPVIYWVRRFAEFGFYPDLLLDASFLSPQAFVVRRGNPVPDDVLVLFAETVTNRIHRISLMARQENIMDLQAEQRSLQDRIALLEQVDADRVESLAEAERRIEMLYDWATSVGEMLVSRMSSPEIPGGDVPVPALDSVQQLLADLDVCRQKAAGLDAAMQTNQELAERIIGIRAELQAIEASPAWRAVTTYRTWFQRNYWRHPWIRSYFEPAVRWGLRRIHIGSQAPSDPPPDVHSAPANPASIDLPPLPATAAVAASHSAAPAPQKALEEGQSFQDWIRANEPGPKELDFRRRMAAGFSYRPKISVIVPVYKVPQNVLADTVTSVLGQTYDNWELCVVHGDPANAPQREYLTKLAQTETRVKVELLPENRGISENSNAALALASGDFIALLDHDDTLAPFALFEVVRLLNEDRSINFIYSDKDQMDESGQTRLSPLFKPAWSPEVMLAANYLTHLSVIRTEHVRTIGGWRKSTDGAQDWDLFLRVIHKFGNVAHIPKILYHWRRIGSSVATGGISAKPYAVEGQIRSISDYLAEAGCNAKTEFDGTVGIRVSWPPEPHTKATVIVLSSNPGPHTVDRAMAIARETMYPDFEVVIPGHALRGHGSRLRLVETHDGATLLERMKKAAATSTGELVVFIDEHVAPTSGDWLAELVGPLRISGVGLTGAKLVDADSRRLLHCGLLFTEDGRLEYLYRGQPEHVCEEFGAANWYRDCSAVSGACFALRRATWDSLGLEDEILPFPRLDVHVCLKVRDTGARLVYNPFARMYQSRGAAIEQPVRPIGPDSFGWIRSVFPDGDPNFNPNLGCRGGRVYLKAAADTPAPVLNYSLESQILVKTYDFSPDLLKRSKSVQEKRRTGQLNRLTWFVPEFSTPFYGGIYTILRFADYFRSAHGVTSTFCVIGRGTPARFRRTIAKAFPELAANANFAVLDNHVRTSELPETDASVSTLWTTAYGSLHFNRTRQKFYFIQDDEALFYPAGSTSALTEATYTFGYKGICNTVSLLNRYSQRGGDGTHFTPCVDAAVFNSEGRRDQSRSGPSTLFWYGRPGHPRNCFELLATALRLLKQRLGDKVLILSAGASWDPSADDLAGVVHNLGLLGFKETGALYRACDAGIAMMMTRHPSYLPLELMGCGSLVITNRNPDTSWLLKDNENCLLADLSPSSLAERIEDGLRDSVLRAKVTTNASALIDQRFRDWNGEMEKVYQYMAGQC